MLHGIAEAARSPVSGVSLNRSRGQVSLSEEEKRPESPASPDIELPKSDSRSAAVAKLFREHNQALLRFLVTKLHSEQEARDVAQEAYVRILNLDTPELVSHLRAYLFKTAANLAIDRLRSRAVEHRVLELDFFDEPPREPDPGRGLAASEELQLIARCLQELPAKCRQAFLLRRIDGMSSSEISKAIDVPERTVRHYIVEAIVYCQARLDEEMERGTIGDGASHGR